ncbi:hypothetical protein [Roseateles toxinivorans]|uniref:Uncharacterized protein n=1 Tax=Roseateles toxinivorans TaxID=270368 RepID=A0A4R6QMT5_9BURK|nr:hypothetical protein [Roseateles toxinivorans]TDP72276.1 hypothetical protein DES47_10221 [Roseateles toxinivorans]
MFHAKTNGARPRQDQCLRSSAPFAARRMVTSLEALDQLQLWSTRRVRIAYLTQPKPLAG